MKPIVRIKKLSIKRKRNESDDEIESAPSKRYKIRSQDKKLSQMSPIVQIKKLKPPKKRVQDKNGRS